MQILFAVTKRGQSEDLVNITQSKVSVPAKATLIARNAKYCEAFINVNPDLQNIASANIVDKIYILRLMSYQEWFFNKCK